LALLLTVMIVYGRGFAEAVGSFAIAAHSCSPLPRR
jgi:hypothetical protein